MRMLGDSNLGAILAQRSDPYHGSPLARAVQHNADRYVAIVKRRRTIGRLTDPHHVAKQMKRELFINLKVEVKKNGIESG